ncbi:MAG TPA: DUF1579 family protein [Bacteroidota bacterium]|nr:DUF1579 family protein [Bacteroidota bacterium]
MKKLAFILITFVLSNSLVLLAQDAPAFQAPGPGPERAKLGFLIGNFTTETHIMPSPMSEKETVGKGNSNLAWGVDSMFVLMNDQSLNPMMGNYKAHGVLGYDMREKKYILSMFNNFGDNPQYRGTMNGDTLTLTSKINFPQGSFDQKLVWFKEGNNVRLKIFNDMGDGYTLVIDQTATPSGEGAQTK